MRGPARVLTPAMARERTRIGALRGRTIGGLPSLPVGVSTSVYGSAVQTAISQQASSVQNEIAAQTGVDTTSATVTQGAGAAVSLLNTGYDPSNTADSANLVHVIAAGLCLVPGIGPILGGAVEALWAVGNAVACPLENAFASIGFGPACGAPPCKTSGNWTAATVLQENAGALPAMPRGSLASLMIPALAYTAAQAAHCQYGPPPAAIVDAVVSLWNKTHAGPAAPYYVPSIGEGAANQVSTFLLGGRGESVSGSSASARAGVVPNIFYAFGPAQAATAAGLAFSGTAISFNPFPVTSGAPPGVGLTAPRLLMVNTGELLPPAPAPVIISNFHLGPPPAPVKALLPPLPDLAAKPAAPAGMSAGEKLAAAAGLGAAAALVWWLRKNRWRWVTPRWAGRLVR